MAAHRSECARCPSVWLLVLAIVFASVEHFILSRYKDSVSESIARQLRSKQWFGGGHIKAAYDLCDEDGRKLNTSTTGKQRERYVSYQPPGNGWNNQRQALELAIIMAKLLQRTLIVHPMAAHQLGLELKRPHKGPDGKQVYRSGYEAYNAMTTEQLTPVSKLIDLERMRELLPVVEWVRSHVEFEQVWSNRTWRRVCHSGGHGYWVDRLPSLDDFQTRSVLRWQQFSPAGGWQDKCQKEIEFLSKQAWKRPLVRSVLDELSSAEEDVIYFAEGTLFGMDIRFLERDKALEATHWIMEYVIPSSDARDKASAVKKRIHPYNAVHVRRGDHQLRHAAPSLWLKKMKKAGFLENGVKNLYIASDERNEDWFKPFKEEGYTTFFAKDFNDVLQPEKVPAVARSDILGVFEQAILIDAEKFVLSPGSTFSVFISRSRNELGKRDGLLTSGTRVKWLRHTTRV